jgi:integrase
MARKRSDRVHGPYRHGGRWRVVVVRRNGARDVRSFATEDEAKALVRSVTRTIDGSLVVKEAVELYEAWLATTGIKPVSVTSARDRLDRALGPYFAQPVSLVATKGKLVYQTLRAAKKPGTEKPYAVATHRNTLMTLRHWGAFLVEHGHLKANPFTAVKPVGRPNRGKKQLRVTEARVLVETCLRHLAAGDLKALQPLLALFLGLRASEVADLECRDIDDDGRLVWVADAKTEAGRRYIEAPLMLRPTLAALAVGPDGRTKEGPLLPGASRFTVLHQVRRFCRLAKVPPITAHGLRGTHATLATSAGATAELVMAALGHTSTEVARLHYTDQGVAGAAKGRRVATLLEAGNANPDTVPREKT